MLRIIQHIIKKEFIQTFRDKRMLLPIFVAPVLQLILLGYAATTDIKNIALGVLDQDSTQESRALLSALQSTDSFQVKPLLSNSREIDEMIRKEKIEAAIVIPSGFAKKLKKGSGASLQIILDGSDANSATIIMSDISRFIAFHSQHLMSRIQGRRLEGMVSAEPRIWYNPELKSSLYMVPGVICLILLLTTLILTAMGITREREMGTLENLIVSPIRPWELIIGKTAPFVAIGLSDAALIIIAGKLIFGLPIRGSLIFLFGVCLLFILTTLSFGLFISTVSRTQQQAMMSAFFFVLPAMLLSGIFSPIESMPKSIQYLTLLNPLRYFGKAVRGILLKGNGMSILWKEVLVMLIFGLAAIVLSSLRFRKRLE